MDLAKIDLFRMAGSKMGWLAERQKILAQNIANADTPRYNAKDLKSQNFSRLLQNSTNMRVMQTSIGHIEGTALRSDFRTVKERNSDVYEVNPNENGIIMEEQLMKVSESSMHYQLASNLYRKNLSMFRLALGIR